MIGIWRVKHPCETCGREWGKNDQVEISEYCCDCCGRVCDEKNELQVKRLGAWLMGVDLDICSECFGAWYDGEADPKKIRLRVLAGKA